MQGLPTVKYVADMCRWVRGGAWFSLDLLGCLLYKA